MRLPGWEIRLHDVMAAAAATPYVIGQHDCFRLACRVVEALTGVDRWPDFAGYNSKREALRQIARRGASFEAAGDWFFGAGTRIAVPFARRGDIAALQPDPAGEKHLGVVCGKHIAVLIESGLGYVPLRSAHCAWRVG
jgi:hypothetical protein